MPSVGKKFQGALARTFPDCVMLSQAVAFNMFLAFFPMLLFALGLIISSESILGAVRELPERLQLILPPGSERVVLEYLTRRGVRPGPWIWLGLGGTLLAGTQVMSGLMDGFRIIAGVNDRPNVWLRQLRALVLLIVTLAPWIAAVTLTMFGRQVRTWVIRETGLPIIVKSFGAVLYISLVVLLAYAVLIVVYYFGQPGQHRLRVVFPGAMVAAILWWLLNVSFGWYVRHMPYTVVYGGLAAAIGLIIWMYMIAIVVFIGAAYNVESELARGRSPERLLE